MTKKLGRPGLSVGINVFLAWLCFRKVRCLCDDYWYDPSKNTEEKSVFEKSKTGVLPQKESQGGKFASSAGSGLVGKGKNPTEDFKKSNFKNDSGGVYGAAGVAKSYSVAGFRSRSYSRANQL